MTRAVDIADVLNDKGLISALDLATGAVRDNMTIARPLDNASLNTGGSFTLTEKSLCVFVWSSSAYTNTTVGLMLNYFSIDGIGTINSINQYANEINSHKAFPTGVVLYTLNAGTYTVRVTTANAFDGNDRCSCLVLGFRVP